MANKVAFSSDEFRTFKLEKVDQVSHDTKVFRVALPSAEHEMGMKTASCLLLQGEKADIVRPYTPTTLNSQKGYFELVIKRYEKGAVSSYMHGLSVGDEIKVKGPIMKLDLTENYKKAIGMIAGGTGITPMYQCAMEIMTNPADNTLVTLLYANNTPGDILLKKELDQLAADHDNFKVVYKVSDADGQEWKAGIGHVNKDDVMNELPRPSDDHLIMVCGPPGMMGAISGPKNEDKTQGELSGLLKELDYTSDQVYKF